MPELRKAAVIEKTPGICGGAACIAGTRLPVWVLAGAKELGATDGQLLADYPGLTAEALAGAWGYAADHRTEIDDAICRNAT
jgi:uncharacterized protein (DUF433 family)